MAKQTDELFLETVVKALVDNPDDVKVVRNVDEMGVLLSLSLHPEDMGKIIGRQGNTVQAIRTLLRVIGLKNKARVNLRIEEPEGGRVAPASAPASAPAKGVDDVVDELKL